jgi:hypothetical protein
LSSISSNLANILEGLKAQNADAKADPAKALKRLKLDGKAGQPYVDVVHFGATDLGVVTRKLDDEREGLEQASARTKLGADTLTTIEGLLTEAKDLVESNVKGSSPGKRKANQRKIDALMTQIDTAVKDANETLPDLFTGSTNLKAGDAAVKVDEISRESLGKLVLNGKVMSLRDVVTRGGLDTARRRGSAEGARRSITEATQTVTELREKLQSFQSESVRPRLGDIANALAGLFEKRSEDLGSSDAALKVAGELRESTLASSTAAFAVGADGWDRDRIVELLT